MTRVALVPFRGRQAPGNGKLRYGMVLVSTASPISRKLQNQKLNQYNMLTKLDET